MQDLPLSPFYKEVQNANGVSSKGDAMFVLAALIFVIGLFGYIANKAEDYTEYFSQDYPNRNLPR